MIYIEDINKYRSINIDIWLKVNRLYRYRYRYRYIKELYR